MGMTFLQQQGKLSRLLGDPNTGTDDQWPLADRKFEINRGEKKFAKDSRSLLKYVTGTVTSQGISLPSGFQEVHVLVVDDIVMTGKDEIALQEYETYIDSGEDKFWFWENASGTRQLNFIDSNSNNLTYKLWYFGKPTVDLSADADESPFEDEYREASVYWAASELLEQIGKTQLADRNRFKYQALVQEAYDETQKKIMNITFAYPFTGVEEEFDKDIQGRGNLIG